MVTVVAVAAAAPRRRAGVGKTTGKARKRATGYYADACPLIAQWSARLRAVSTFPASRSLSSLCLSLLYTHAHIHTYEYTISLFLSLSVLVEYASTRVRVSFSPYLAPPCFASPLLCCSPPRPRSSPRGRQTRPPANKTRVRGCDGGGGDNRGRKGARRDAGHPPGPFVRMTLR